jgi:hypothetical protein
LAAAKATLKLIAWLKLKTAVEVGAGILLVGGAVTVATTLQGGKTEHLWPGGPRRSGEPRR